MITRILGAIRCSDRHRIGPRHLYRVEIDATVRATAVAFTEPTPRMLDATHLATAQILANEAGVSLTAFVTYDRRLLAAASTVGLPTAAPGLSPSS
jgi:uncharacterized protein